jgi:hypothetical protein
MSIALFHSIYLYECSYIFTCDSCHLETNCLTVMVGKKKIIDANEIFREQHEINRCRSCRRRRRQDKMIIEKIMRGFRHSYAL